MMWPGLLAAERPAAPGELVSTSRSPTAVVATSIPAARHRLVEAVVGHDRHSDAVARQPAGVAQVQRCERDQLVAVDDRALAVDREHAVAVAVEGEADVEA